MRDRSVRRPGAVPDGGAGDLSRWGQGDPGLDGAPVRWGTDTDADGRPDTLLTTDGADLLVQTDLDGDGLADRILRIGPDASVHEVPAHEVPVHEVPGHQVPGHQVPGHPGPPPAVDDPVAGHAPAVHRPWVALLGRLLGLDP